MIEKRMHILGNEIELPKGWKYKKIVDCCATCFSGKSPKYSKEPTNNKVIGQAANQRYGIDLKFVKYVTDEFAQKQDDKFYLRYKDVLLNTLGTGSIGRAGIYKHTEKMLTDGHPFVFRTGEKCIPEYLYYYFVLNEQNIINSASGSTNQKFLKLKEFTELEIPVPQIDEQKHIVEHIETLFSSIDNIVETLNKTKNQLKVYREAVLKEAFNATDTFATVQLQFIVEDIHIGPFGTMLHKRDYIENAIPVINPKHIKKQEIVPDSKVTISEDKAEELSSYQLKKNDVIMGRRGEMGRAAPITEQEEGWICGTGSIIIRLKEQYDASFYSQILASPDIVHYLEEQSTGTTMDNLNEGIVKQIPVPNITTKDQMIIKQLLDTKISLCQKIEDLIEKTLSQTEAMRQSILKEAFEGRFV